jgi:hypothetical protein
MHQQIIDFGSTTLNRRDAFLAENSLFHEHIFSIFPSRMLGYQQGEPANVADVGLGVG